MHNPALNTAAFVPPFPRLERFFARLRLLLAAGAAVCLLPLSGLTLSDAEADAILSEWGLEIASMPEDILEAFRAAAQDVATLESQPAGYSSASTAGFGMMSAGWTPPPFPNPDCTEWSFSNPTSYENWIAFFDVPNPENPTGPTLLDGHTGFHDSFANDGLPNLLKYALGLNPAAAGRICLPHPELIEDQIDTYLAVRFTRPNWITGVMHTLESTPDLFVWTQHHDPVEIIDPISNSSYEEVRLLDPEPFDPFARRFLRLRTEVDTGIYVTVECLPEEGVMVTVDSDKWQSDNQSEIGVVDSVVIQRATNPDGNFSTIASGFGGEPEVIYLDRTVNNGITYYYRAYLGYSSSQGFQHSPFSNTALTYVDCARPASELVASCRPDRIVLMWSAPEWALPPEDEWGFSEIDIQDWFLMRSTDPNLPLEDFEDLNLGSSYSDLPGGLFADTTVVPETTYYYYVYFTYYDWTIGTSFTSPRSAVISASTCEPPPQKGPMDITIILDNTGSMGTALTQFKNDIGGVLAEIENASSDPPDYRLALVTPDNDIVNVRVPFTQNNKDDFLLALNDPEFIESGIGAPESTDECLNTVINGLWEFHRNGPAQECPSETEIQIGNFFPPFGIDDNCNLRTALRTVILITDEVPGGFCDTYNAQIQENEKKYAIMARCNNTRIAAILIGKNQQAAEVMTTYAEVTGGWHLQLPSNGMGIADAILEILYGKLPDLPPMPDCNEFSPYNPCSP